MTILSRSKIMINMIQAIQGHISFQWYQNYFFQSIILFTQYIQIPNPSSEHNLPNNLFKHTAYSFVFFGHFYTCKPIIYTYKPLIYTRKKWEKGVTSIVSSKSYENNSCKPEN